MAWCNRFLVPALSAILAACQAAPPPVPVAVPMPVDGVAAVALNAPIFPRSRDLLIAEIDRLVAAGARTVRIAINSPGGDITAAQAIVEHMNRVRAEKNVSFEAYDVGMVASAATYVFLNAQRRYARAGTSFLFHAAGLVSNGAVSAARLREEADKIENYERTVGALMRARTRLSPAQIDVYLHRTVLLTAEDALRDGVVDAIATLPTRPGGTLAVIGTSRPPVVAPPAPAAPVQPVNGR